MITCSSPRAHVAALAACSLIAALAVPLAESAAGESRWQGGGHFFVAFPQGDLGRVFGTGVGLEPAGVYRLPGSGALGLRVQGGFIDYGSEVEAVPLKGAGPSFGVQIMHKRNATTLGLGPQLMWPRGRLRPYAYALAGGAMYNSRVDISGRDSLGRWRVLTTDLNRTVLGLGAGGGVGFSITRRASIDAGVEYRRYFGVRTIGNGAVELPDGRVFVTENRGDFDMLLVRVGFTAALSAGRHARSPSAAARAAVDSRTNAADNPRVGPTDTAPFRRRP